MTLPRIMASPRHQASTAAEVAVKVFMKNDSPPNAARLRPFMKPPSAFVSIWRPAEWLTIAPPSALMDSPRSRVAKAME